MCLGRLDLYIEANKSHAINGSPAVIDNDCRVFIMLKRAVGFALAFDLLLTCCDGLFPFLHGILPLAGSPLAQLGICLALAVVVVEVREALN